MKQYHLINYKTNQVVWLDKDVHQGSIIKLKGDVKLWYVEKRYRRDDQPAWWLQVEEVMENPKK